MIQMSKDVTIGEHEYKVGRLKAHAGAWIISLLRGKAQASGLKRAEASPEPAKDAPQPSFEEGLMATTVYLIGQLSFEEMKAVQDLCLEQCAQYEAIGGKQIPMPILAGPGRWAIADLEYDGPTVLSLTRECLAFNIAPFFTLPGSN